jgi:hypothetical protein
VRNSYKIGSLKDKRRNRQMKGNIIGNKWAIKDKIQIRGNPSPKLRWDAFKEYLSNKTDREI